MVELAPRVGLVEGAPLVQLEAAPQRLDELRRAVDRRARARRPYDFHLLLELALDLRLHRAQPLGRDLGAEALRRIEGARLALVRHARLDKLQPQVGSCKS